MTTITQDSRLVPPKRAPEWYDFRTSLEDLSLAMLAADGRKIA